MVTASILIHNEFEQEEYRDFHFDINAVNGIYVVDENQMGIILSGNDYILKYSYQLFVEIQSTLKLKKIGFN